MLDAVIAGSGYGGSVLAARLAESSRVLVVERGRRYSPSALPRGIPGLLSSYGNLWGMRFGPGTGVAFASGLGGASLVNYGITSRPDDRVFSEWPIGAREMDPYFERALAVLRPERSPRAGSLADHVFLDQVEPGLRVDLASTIDWRRCTDCGRCVPGCRIGAKRTLETSYLGLARASGAEFLLETEVVDIEPLSPVGYLVTLRSRWGKVERVRTRLLVLAAGTFGTLDLLRSVRARFPVSGMFGRRMSMNGNALAFLQDSNLPTSIGHGAPITTTVRIPCEDPGGRRGTLTVMAGRIPAGLRGFAGAFLALGARLAGESPGIPGDSAGARAKRLLADIVGIPSSSGLARTFLYKIDATDRSAGEAVFDPSGRSAISWPDYAADPILRHAVLRLREWARKMGGRVLLGPGTSTSLPGLGVHPLGGCRMARTIEDGVVDRSGRLFRPGGGVYPGLVVADGSALPTSLGVPSSLTIAAFAERVAEGCLEDLRTRSF